MLPIPQHLQHLQWYARHLAWLRSCGYSVAHDPGAAAPVRAVVRGAVLTRADLTRAVLTPIRDDLFAVLDQAPSEVPALLDAIRAGRIDGTAYQGECACLVGTIAKARGCDYRNLGGICPDSQRPAERWFLALRPGAKWKPEHSAVARLTERWILEWQERRAATVASGA